MEINDNKIKIHKVTNLLFDIDYFIKYIVNNNYNENMFKSDGTLNPNYNSFKKTGLIAEIIEDHWDTTYSKNKEIIDKYRPNASKEISKVINCHNKNLGCSVFECPNCHDYIFVGHTCKSRFCTSCGYKYKLDRVDSIVNSAYNCNHRQIVFTIAQELWKYFFDFELINILFEAVNKTIYSILNETFKKKKKIKKIKKYFSKIKYTPGFFAFLHTFGRDMKWNPHIHVLIAEIKMCDDESIIYKKWDYFNYDALSKRFQFILLDLMSKHIGKSFDKEKNNLFKKYKNGFYVYAEKRKFKNFKSGVEYITRYSGRAAISENRIINYDGTNVIFCYNDHKDDEYHEISCTAEEFILILLRHLIPYNLKTIRYYGFYRKKHKFHDKMILLVNKGLQIIRKPLNNHRFRIITYFNRDPYCCPNCKTTMKHVCEIIGGG